jgi:hypothetical protein
MPLRSLKMLITKIERDACHLAPLMSIQQLEENDGRLFPGPWLSVSHSRRKTFEFSQIVEIENSLAFASAIEPTRRCAQTDHRLLQQEGRPRSGAAMPYEPTPGIAIALIAWSCSSSLSLAPT